MDWKSDSEYFSSDDNSYDSDIIDSDIEADLYSTIHHQAETSVTNINECSIQENNEIEKSNYSKQHKTNVNGNDVSGEIYTVNTPQNSQNFVDVQTIIYLNENNGKLTKRKSNVVSDLLNEFQLSTKRFKTTVTTKSNKSHYKDTSDDDSDIICLGSQEKEKQFQINLSNNTISLDCSSDSNDSWYGRLSNNSSTLSNRSLKDLWRIDEDDLYRYKRRSRRYHEDDRINCSNCNEKGHIARNCSAPPAMKCYFCGKNHNPVNCNKRTCAKCFKMGHDSRLCKTQISSCMLCNMIGHPAHECPDLWRRYHLTTTNVIMRNSRLNQDRPIFCYNCGDSGHFGGICKESKMNTFQTWPLVIDYSPSFIAPRLGFGKPFIDLEERKRRVRMERNKRKRERRRMNYSEKKRLKAEIKEEKRMEAQQNDFPRTPKSEPDNETSLNESTNFMLQEQKRQILKAKKLKVRLGKLEILRQQILCRPVNIPFPLLDFSGQNELPYSYKSLRNRAKKERKMLRQLVEETYGPNNISVPFIKKN